jgi:Tfp pilus assembly protein PilF
VLFTGVLKSVRAYRQWFSRWRCAPVRRWIAAAELYKQKRFEEAAALYRLGLAARPKSPAALNAMLDLSHCLFRMKQFEEAEQCLRQATVAAPHEAEAYIRLARLQLWLGHAAEAVWTMRVCLQRVSVDPELATLFVTAVVESKGADAAVAEAQSLLSRIHSDGGFPRLDVARVRLGLLGEERSSCRDELSKLASIDRGPFEAVVAFAEVLLQEGKISYARHHLHRALVVAPEHPKVLRLLASVYLRNGESLAPEYSVQLGIKACQATGWRGVHELLTLANAYVAVGDKLAALLVATKARETVGGLLGSYPEVERLERLLQEAPPAEL